MHSAALDISINLFPAYLFSANLVALGSATTWGHTDQRKSENPNPSTSNHSLIPPANTTLLIGVRPPVADADPLWGGKLLGVVRLLVDQTHSRARPCRVADHETKRISRQHAQPLSDQSVLYNSSIEGSEMYDSQRDGEAPLIYLHTHPKRYIAE
jgi:hypothetical protein